MKTYRVYTLDSCSEDEMHLTFVLAARRPTPGPRQMNFGPATGLSLSEAKKQVSELKRTGDLAFFLEEPIRSA
jgi:hypothetical protein